MMIESLFGDLAPRRLSIADSPPGVALDLPVHDLLVEDSPAAAMRTHFAARRAAGCSDAGRAMITLLDPSRLWASQVIHALSRAAASAVERLNLREVGTLRTLAVIERTTVPRHGACALKVVHADVRDPGAVQHEIAHALAEGSQLTAVIVGAMQPHALLAWLRGLVEATRSPDWCCPWLVFVLPPAAAALRQRILEQPWPAEVRVVAVTENEGSAASVWNVVLGAWEATRGEPHPAGGGSARAPQPAPAAALPGPALRPPSALLARVLAPLAPTEGLLACGIVDLGRGDLLASDQRQTEDADLAALALALCAARQAHTAVAGEANAPDEVLITAGTRQTLLRRLPGPSGLGFVALMDRTRVNLALLRFRLMDAERHLG